jgi:hypothetical protein
VFSHQSNTSSMILLLNVVFPLREVRSCHNDRNSNDSPPLSERPSLSPTDRFKKSLEFSSSKVVSFVTVIPLVSWKELSELLWRLWEDLAVASYQVQKHLKASA